MNSIETRLAMLEDREAIRTLIALYGPLADAGNAARAAALWTPDGGYDIGSHGVHRGRAAIARLLNGAEHRALVEHGVGHLLSVPVIELSGDHATAWTHSCVLRRSAEGWVVHRVAANRWQLVRTDEGWRVAERINRLLDGDTAGPELFASVDA